MGLDGKPRQLHIDESMQCIDFSRTDWGPEGDAWHDVAGGRRRHLVSCDYFTVEEFRGNSLAIPNNDRCAIVMMISGSGTVATAAGQAELGTMQTLLVPAAAGGATVQGDNLRCLVAQPVFKLIVGKNMSELPLSNCAIHTFTTKPWSLPDAVAKYAAAGIGGVSVWRQHVEAVGLDVAKQCIADSGLRVPAYVRGGFFTAHDAADRAASIDDNKRCIDEAAAVGAEQLVLVVGATPGMPLAEARKQVAEGIAACCEHAKACNVQLAIEPLHPMYAGDKSCVNSMTTAREVWQQVDDDIVGVAVDVYHVWFDERLDEEITLAGAAGKIFGFHVCDWKCDTNHLLLDRGLMGEGVIDIPAIRNQVEAAGFNGMNEVEIFSTNHWQKIQDDWLAEIIGAYQQYV